MNLGMCSSRELWRTKDDSYERTKETTDKEGIKKRTTKTAMI